MREEGDDAFLAVASDSCRLDSACPGYTGPTRLIYACVVLLLTLLFADCASFHGSRRWYAIGFPLATLLFVWIIVRTAILNLSQGGISWRGIFYPLAELKRNRV